MHPIDSIIALLFAVGFIIFLVSVIKQIWDFVLRWIGRAFAASLILFMLLGIYRIVDSPLFYYVITPLFGVESSTVSTFLKGSLVINYVLGLIDSFIGLSQLKVISGGWPYIEFLWANFTSSRV